MGLLLAGAIPLAFAGGERRDLSVAVKDGETSFLRQLRLRDLFGVAGLVDRQARLREDEGRHQRTAVRRFRSRRGAGDRDRRQEFVVMDRSEERRVGKEGRSRGSTY